MRNFEEVPIFYIRWAPSLNIDDTDYRANTGARYKKKGTFIRFRFSKEVDQILYAALNIIQNDSLPMSIIGTFFNESFQAAVGFMQIR